MKLIFSLGLALFLTASRSQAGNLPGYTTLFTLERTSNTNQVVYEANLDNSDNPIHAYWIMRAQDGHTEELTSTERTRVYGTKLISATPEVAQFSIVSFQSRPITVRLDPTTHAPYATMNMNHQDRILIDFFLNLGGFLIPHVNSVDLTYEDTLDGPALHDTFNPNRSSD
jgi:hypothetical protein